MVEAKKHILTSKGMQALEEELQDLKEALHLDENSRILCFSTEGDTDKENYRKIVWGGAYASGNCR